jgi:arginase
MKEMNFLGLGIEVGQEKSGLARSHHYFRRYFPFLKRHGIKIIDQGEVCSSKVGGQKIHSVSEISDIDWSPYVEAYAKIKELYRKPQPLLNWGGDHSVALATVGAFCSQYPDGYVVWVDAHTDINLPEHSLSGNLHGMPLSILLNVQNIQSERFPWLQKSLAAGKLIYVGVRDLDPFEKEVVRDLDIKTFTSSEVHHRGMATIAREIFELVKNHPLHLSFDIDSLSPEYAPATGVKAYHGLELADLRCLGEELSKHKFLRSVDVVEINPALGTSGEVSQTYLAALIFLMSVFYQGEIYDGIGGSDQTINSAQMESRP